ncbi:MAG: MFS transporter, partial [Deltaproteobacteria bacterium]|nr:MFS transporter [Deltaproteobacteria bacterium]
MDQVKQKPMYRFLMVLTIASTVGLQAWLTLFNNFAVEVAGLQGKHIGVIQSVREFPGFLALLAVYVMLIVREHRLSALSILFLGLGLGATGLFPSYSGLLITTVIMSFGFHYWNLHIPCGPAAELHSDLPSYRLSYCSSGRVGSDSGAHGPRHRAAAKKDDLSQKVLAFLFPHLHGWRKKADIHGLCRILAREEIQLLRSGGNRPIRYIVINNLINYFLAPLIGKSIIRFGERKVLSLEYLSLIFIFLAYATVESRIVVAILYILDHIFFNFAMAIRTYFQKVGDPRDIAPSMAMGFTINHLAAVFLPAIGGILWM